MEYKYTVLLEHEQEKLSCKFDVSDLDWAEKIFWSNRDRLKEEIGDFSLKCIRNNDNHILLELKKDY